MKLKCDLHNRRVITGLFGFVHRTGDGSSCTSPTASIGRTIIQLWGSEGVSYTSTSDRTWAPESMVATEYPKPSTKKNRKEKRNAA